jgi:hypothetical protein
MGGVVRVVGGGDVAHSNSNAFYYLLFILQKHGKIINN